MKSLVRGLDGRGSVKYTCRYQRLPDYATLPLDLISQGFTVLNYDGGYTLAVL